MNLQAAKDALLNSISGVMIEPARHATLTVLTAPLKAAWTVSLVISLTLQQVDAQNVLMDALFVKIKTPVTYALIPTSAKTDNVRHVAHSVLLVPRKPPATPARTLAVRNVAPKDATSARMALEPITQENVFLVPRIALSVKAMEAVLNVIMGSMFGEIRRLAQDAALNVPTVTAPLVVKPVKKDTMLTLPQEDAQSAQIHSLIVLAAKPRISVTNVRIPSS